MFVLRIMLKSKMEKSLIIIKPDAIERNLLGEILHRLERKGLKIIGLKMIQITDALAAEHYVHHKDKPFFADLAKFMKSMPVAVVALVGINAVSAIRLIVGPTKGYMRPIRRQTGKRRLRDFSSLMSFLSMKRGDRIFSMPSTTNLKS